ncbi:response regulator [Cohnella mopanensis]|uniref:response regulator n=1 Tax=Cohnella mopanensis TaxID=2911966 RepID=UPI001EF80CC7|nr:response regulator [Cohnella mopanensis]
MRAILIDDEKPALAQIEWLLERDGRLEVAAKFTSAREGMKYLESHKAEIVFLDIEMPGLNGLEAAEHIWRIDPEIRIVYITAYSEYAIEAFDLNALDYLLKPVHPERFKRTVTRIIEDLSRIRIKMEQPVPPQATTFKRLALHDGGMSDTSLKHLRALRTLKAQELFAYFIHYKDQWISKDQLLETLWPGGIYEKTTVLLHTSVYQIRKLLKEWNVNAAIEYALDSYRLASDSLIIDKELFERESAELTVQSEARREAVARALSLYAGDYLEEHDYDWAVSHRTELRQKYVRLASNLADYEAATGREKDALDRLTALHAQELYSDEICLRIMKLLAGMRDYEAAIAYYDKFEQLLREDLNADPDSTLARYAEHLAKDSVKDSANARRGR